MKRNMSIPSVGLTYINYARLESYDEIWHLMLQIFCPSVVSLKAQSWDPLFSSFPGDYLVYNIQADEL